MNLAEEKFLINILEKRKVYWEPLIAAGAILIAIFGVMVPLFIHSDSTARQQIDGIRQEVEAIRQDIRSFEQQRRQDREDFQKQMYELKLEQKKGG